MSVLVTVNNEEDKRLWREAENAIMHPDDNWEFVKDEHKRLRAQFIRQQKKNQKEKYYATH